MLFLNLNSSLLYSRTAMTGTLFLFIAMGRRVALPTIVTLWYSREDRQPRCFSWDGLRSFGLPKRSHIFDTDRQYIA